MWIFRSGQPDCDDDRRIIVGVSTYSWNSSVLIIKKNPEYFCLINISDSEMNVDFNFLDCPSLVAKCSLLSVSPTFYDKRDDFTFPLVIVS
jgi:hypothetical protein